MKLLNTLILVILITLAATVQNARAYQEMVPSAKSELTVSPNRCVALRRGQTCFKDVTIKWHTDVNSNYCLRIEGSDDYLHCWSGTRQAMLKFDFQSTASKTIQLVNQKNNQVLLETEITIAWVYKSKSRAKASWRLF